MIINMDKNEFSLSFLRHGPKKEVEEKEIILEDSGLTSEQQTKWKEAMENLGFDKVELSYKALPAIEKKANEIFEALPEKALLIFFSTEYPRNKMTTELLMNEVMDISKKSHKDIRVAYFFETPEEKQNLNSFGKNLSADMMPLMAEEMKKQDTKDAELVEKYFVHGGHLTIPGEDEMVKSAANKDLAKGEDSYLRQRGKLFREQYDKLKKDFADQKMPVFFFGVTHHSAIIAADAEFNGRNKYKTADEIPKPLSLWRIQDKKE